LNTSVFLQRIRSSADSGILSLILICLNKLLEVSPKSSFSILFAPLLIGSFLYSYEFFSLILYDKIAVLKTPFRELPGI